jgi:hypothetical protein
MTAGFAITAPQQNHGGHCGRWMTTFRAGLAGTWQKADGFQTGIN